MLRLTQTFGAHAGRVTELDRDVIRFGRLPDNEIAFDPHADLDASGRHAELRKEGQKWVLLDTGSRNGTLVGGRRVTRHVIAGGEEIEFGVGGPRIRVEVVAPRSAPAGIIAGVETAAATPVAMGSKVGPADTINPPSAHPTPPPSPFGPPVGSPAPPALNSPMPQQQMPQQQMPQQQQQQSPVAGTVDEQRRFGQRTVGLMIQAALEQADRNRGPSSSPEMMHAVAAEHAKRSGRGTRILVVLLTLLVLAAIGGVVGVFLYSQQEEQDLRDENVDLQRRLAALGDNDGDERRRLEGRIQQINDRLNAPQVATGSRIADQNQGAVYLLLIEPTNERTRRQGLCSAFAVRSNLLATNAHCVSALERAMGRGQTVHAIPNRGGPPLNITQMWRHPMFVPDVPVPNPDVGLLRVDGPVRQQVRLATMQDLATLHVGDDVFVYGFPGDVSNSNTPVAVLNTGVVGRMTQFDGSDAQFPLQSLISHSASVSGGLSGSPLLDSQGRVIAINAGNYRGDTRVVDPGTRLGRTLNTETAYAWAVRADLLIQLLEGLPPQ